MYYINICQQKIIIQIKNKLFNNFNMINKKILITKKWRLLLNCTLIKCQKVREFQRFIRYLLWLANKLSISKYSSTNLMCLPWAKKKLSQSKQCFILKTTQRKEDKIENSASNILEKEREIM